LVVRSTGSGTSATLFGIGRFSSESVSGAAAGTQVSCGAPAATPAAGTGFDSTTALQADLVATFSVANSGNALTLHHFTLESTL